MSAKANGREAISSFGRVFKLTFGHFDSKQHNCIPHMQPLLAFKTWPRFCPVN